MLRRFPGLVPARLGIASFACALALTSGVERSSAAAPRPHGSYPRPVYIDARQDVESVGASVVAQFDALVTAEHADTTWLESVRTLEPSIKVICFFSAASVKDTLAGGWDPADTSSVALLRKVNVIQNDWLLKDVDGNPIIIWEAPWGNNWAVNLTEHCRLDDAGDRYGTWVPRAIARRFSPGGFGAARWPGWTGVMLDEMSNGMAWTEAIHGNGEIDSDGDGVADDDDALNAAWRAEQDVLLTDLRARLGDGRTLVLNGDTTVLEHTDGQMFEDCLHVRTWWEDMYGYPNHGGYLRNLALSRAGPDQLCIFQARYYVDTATMNFDQFARLAAGSSCLGDGYFSLEKKEDGVFHPVSQSPVYAIDMGTPDGDLLRVPANGDTLYERAFSRGYVQVNPNTYAIAGVPARDAVFTEYLAPSWAAVDPRPGSAGVRWRVPDIAGNPALVTGFDIRVAEFPIDEGNWELAQQVRVLNHVGLWEPGDLIEAEIDGLRPSATYHVAARTVFRARYLSQLSPSFRFHTLPDPAGWSPPEGAGAPGNPYWWGGFAGNAPNGTVRALLARSAEVVLGGDFNHLGSVAAAHVGRWDGSRFRTLGAGLNGPVHALTQWAGRVVAGGTFTAAGSSPVLRVATWDGREWVPIGAGFNGPVRALVVWRGQLVAAGEFSLSGSRPLNGIAAWNGREWTPLGFGMNEGLSLASAPVLTSWDDALITQSTLADDGEAQEAVVAWHGSEWDAVGAPLAGSIYALGTLGDDLVIGGEFATIADLAANNIARWDGTRWLPFGPGLSGRVLAIGTDGNSLVAGGSFTTSGDASNPFLARWDGVAFTPLGTGMDGPVMAIVQQGERLFVGGAFGRSGQRVSPFLARWDQRAATVPTDPNDETPIAPITRPVLAAAAPNPFGSMLSVEYALPASLPVALRVYDVQGHVVATLFDGVQSGGVHRALWDGRANEGGPSAPGVYFLRLEAATFTLAQKVVRSR